MRRNFLSLALLSLLFVPSQVTAQAIPGEYIIKYKDGYQDLAKGSRSVRRSLRALGATPATELPILGLTHVIIDKDAQSTNRAVRSIESDPRIEYIEPVYRVGAMATPNDLVYTLGGMWGLNNTGQYGAKANVDVDAPEAWDITTGASNDIIVAVIDTGIKYDHPDISANIWTNPGEIPNNGIDDDNNGFVDDVHGFDFHNGDGDPKDDNFHGSHVAGTIAASGNNSRGVVGVAYGAKVMGLKMLDASGAGDTLNGLRAVEYAIMMKRRGHNIRVLNNSWGGGDYSQSMQDAIALASAEGMVVVAAAGNDGADNDTTPIYPASYDVPELITVAALTATGNLASFSNFGRTSVDIAAPGSLIWSTIVFDFYFFSDGTSMAAPHVAGVAALLLSNEPTLTPMQVKNRLLQTAKPLSSLTGKLVSPGVVSAYHALTNTQGPTITVSSSAQSSQENWFQSIASLFFGLFDSDSDGVSDQQELIDNTNRFDKGSYKLRLSDSVFTKYNTFFNQWNFLELIANGSADVSAKVTVYDISGRVVSTIPVTIPAGEQFDVNIHDIVGRPDTYGLVKIDYNKTSGVSLLGRLSHYLPNPDGQTFSFAFVRELRNAIKGKSYASANSYDPQGRGFLVANWAEILNLDPFSRKFTYNLYDQTGAKRYSAQVTVPALGELDLPAGHQFGEGVYLVEFIPHSSSTNYLAAVSRYSSTAGPGSTGANYTFAFSLDAKTGTGDQQMMPTTNRQGGCWTQSNWIEVINVSSRTAGGGLIFRDQNGTETGGIAFSLDSKAQKHFYATGVMEANSIGSVELVAQYPESLVSQSLVYFHDCQTGLLQTAYVAPAQIPVLGNLTGSANTYLGMSNYMQLAVAPDGIGGQSVRLFSGNDLLVSYPFAAGSEWVSQVNLNDYLAPNNYRTVVVRPGVSEKVVGVNVRLREVNGRVDFAMPTVVR